MNLPDLLRSPFGVSLIVFSHGDRLADTRNFFLTVPWASCHIPRSTLPPSRRSLLLWQSCVPSLVAGVTSNLLPPDERIVQVWLPATSDLLPSDVALLHSTHSSTGLISPVWLHGLASVSNHAADPRRLSGCSGYPAFESDQFDLKAGGLSCSHVSC